MIYTVACGVYAFLSLSGVIACIALLFVALDNDTTRRNAFASNCDKISERILLELENAQQRVEIVAGVVAYFPRATVTSSLLARYMRSLKSQPMATNSTVVWAETVRPANIDAFQAAMRAEVCRTNPPRLFCEIICV